MKRRAAQVMVVLALVAAIGALTHQAITRGQAIDAARDRVVAIDTASARIDLALVDIAASERGYVAPGQGVDFWATRVDAALADARGALGSLASLATDASAARFVASASSRVDDLAALDARVRSFAGNGQRQMASDLVFADGYEIIAAARADAAEASSIQRAALSSPLIRDRQIQWASIAGLALLGVIGFLLTFRRPALPEPLVTSLDGPAFDETSPSRTTAIAVDEDAIGAALDASLAGLGEPAPTTAEAQIEPQQVTNQQVEPTLPTTAIDLEAAADVCVDIARLLDMRDLQAVLVRASAVLQADGVIVWVMDPAGQALAPALSHGYAADLVSRLGSLPMNADNATAAAWREKSAQVVEARGDGAGAVAVPLLTADGCIGVLSVEVRKGRERAADVQALARIVAAQLATVVAPPAAESRRAAEA